MTHSLDLDTLTLTGAVQQMQDGQLTSVELVQAVIRRARETDPTHHAYVALDEDLVLSGAVEADRLRTVRQAGPLCGIPVGVKDVIRTLDYPTRAGSHVLDDEPPTTDAEVVARLRKAGAIVVGKLVTHEFALGQDLPSTRNAWAPDHYPGGSSAGAGVAVALGSALAALGTDSAGSVRKPASLNGVVGFKPSLGRLPSDGVIAVSPALDQVGLLARTVEDCRLVYSTLKRPTSAIHHSRFDNSTWRLGLAGDYFGSELDLRVAHVISDAVDVLAANARLDLVPVPFPLGEEAVAAGFMLMAADAAAVHHRWLRERPECYDPRTRAFLLAGYLLPAPLLAAAHATSLALGARVTALLDEHHLDGLVVPTLPLPSMSLAEMDNDRDLPKYIRYTVVANLTGQPSISVPCGFTPEGLPVGINLMGRRGADDNTLAMARTAEAALRLPFHSPRGGRA